MAWATAHNGGRTQVGLNSFYGGAEVFNFVKASQKPTYITGGKGIDPAEANSNGYPTVLNNGGWIIRFYIPQDALLPWASRYVVTWTGAGTILVGGGTVNVSSPNYIEFTPTTNFISLSFTGTPDFANLSCFYKPYASHVGENWDPVFLSKLTAMKPGCLRFMDLQFGNGTNNCSNVQVWADRRPYGYLGWTEDEQRSSIRQTGTVSYALNGSSNDYSLNLGISSPINGYRLTIQIPTSSTSNTNTLSLDNGTTKWPIYRLLGDAIALSSRWPLATRFATFVFDSELGGWLKWGGDLQQADCYMQNGAPYEAMLDLAATVGAHMWVTIPPLAFYNNSDFVTGLCTWFLANAPAWMRLILEGPNEQWATNSSHYIHGNSKQLVRNGGAKPGQAAVSFAATAATYNTGAGTSDIDIGANTIPVGAKVLQSSFPGWIGGNYAGGKNVVAKSGTIITIDGCPAAGSYTGSGGTVSPSATDFSNAYGTGISQAGQAAYAAFGGDKTRYDVLIGVKGAEGATTTSVLNATDRFASTFYVKNSGDPGNAAKLWVTGFCPASYFSHNDFKTNIEIARAYNYSVAATQADKNAVMAAQNASLIVSTGNPPTAARFPLPDVNTMHQNYKTFALGYGVKKIMAYEGDYSPDFTGNDPVATITGATQDAAGCVLTLSNVTNGDQSNSVAASSPFVKGMVWTVAMPAGMVELNARSCTIIGVGAADGLVANQIRVNVDSSAFTAYTSGGTATYTNGHVVVNAFRNACRYNWDMVHYHKLMYANFAALTDAGFTSEFCSHFLFTNSSRKYDQTGNIGDNSGGLWGMFDPSVYGVQAASYDAARLYNENKRRMVW